jgi:hypothetical protein
MCKKVAHSTLHYTTLYYTSTHTHTHTHTHLEYPLFNNQGGWSVSNFLCFDVCNLDDDADGAPCSCVRERKWVYVCEGEIIVCVCVCVWCVYMHKRTFTHAYIYSRAHKHTDTHYTHTHTTYRVGRTWWHLRRSWWWSAALCVCHPTRCSRGERMAPVLFVLEGEWLSEWVCGFVLGKERVCVLLCWKEKERV